MSEPTLVDDLLEEAQHLESLSALGMDQVTKMYHNRAARLRAHATRLREALAEAAGKLDESVRAQNPNACATWILVEKALTKVNGGASPPITPGSPGGHECPSCDLDDSVKVPPGKLLKSTPIKVPAAPPTTPTCANCNRAMQPPGKIQCCSSPLHPRTP